MPTIINGQVLERGSNNPLEGVKVVLMEGTYNGSGSGTYSYRPIDTMITDKQGRYTYKDIIQGDLKDYILRFYKDNYFSITDAQNEVSVEWNKTSSPITKMYAFGWITIRVVNDKPFDYFDKIKIGGLWDAGGLDDTYYGKNTNVTFTKKIRSGEKVALKWFVSKNNTSVSFIDSIYIKPQDTTYYQIKY